MAAINKTINLIANFLICLFFVLTFAITYTGINESVGWYGGFAISIVVVLLSLVSTKQVINNKEIAFYATVLFLFFISVLYNKNLKISAVLQYFRYILIALSLPRIKLNKYIFGIFYYLLCAFFLLSMEDFTIPESLVNNVSRNVISIHLLASFVLYALSKDNYLNSVLSIIPGFLGIIISISSACRSGAFAFSIIVVGTFILLKLSKKRKIFYLTLFVMLGCFVFSKQVTNLINNFATKESVSDNSRWDFIREYLDETLSNFGNILFGSKLENIGILQRQQLNTHNSFVAAHAHFGIFYLLTIIVLIMVAMIVYLKKNKMLLFLLLALCFRAFFDTAAFNGVFDIFFYYLIFENIIAFNCKHPCLFKEEKRAKRKGLLYANYNKKSVQLFGVEN